MGRDIQTTATLQAKTKGFVEAGQQAAKISRAASTAAKEQLKNTKDVEKELGKMGGQLKDLARLQVSLNKEMEKIDKSSETYKKLGKELKEVNKQQTELQRSAGNVERAFRSQGKAVTAAQMSRGGLAQGLIQGALPGSTFLQRGPGMGRQVAGMAMGRMGRGMVGAAAQAPFGGLGAVAQGLQALPFGLGVLPAQALMQTTRQAGAALSFRGSMQQGLPFLGGEQMQQRVAAARRGFSDSEIARKAAQATWTDTVPAGMTQQPSLVSEERHAEIMGKHQSGLEAARDRKMAKALAPRRAITGAGVSLAGMAKPEAFQFAAQMAQIGGGRAYDQSRGFFRTAFAAKTLYGAGPEVSGAFMQAGRRGGLVGGGGRAGGAMAEAIGQATAIGLEGSEINDFLSTIATGIQDWKRTGIPMNSGSITGIARGVGSAIGAVRGMAVARGISGAAQGLAMGGPQSAMDMMMMQAVGYRGGGAAEFEQAQIALEQGKFGAKETGRLMERLTGMGGGGASGRLFARSMLKQKGISIGPSEMQRIGMEGVAGLPETAALTEKELAGRAAVALDPATRRQAEITNKQIKSGDGMIKATQDMELAAANIAGEFSEHLGPMVGDLTGKFKEMSEALGPLIDKLKDLVGGGSNPLPGWGSAGGGGGIDMSP